MTTKLDKLKYPYWAYPSKRAYKEAKRTDLRELEKAINQFRRGCAYAPCAPMAILDDWIKQSKEALSVKIWGR